VFVSLTEAVRLVLETDVVDMMYWLIESKSENPNIILLANSKLKKAVEKITNKNSLLRLTPLYDFLNNSS
jgi:hypothetical protein